MSIFWRLIFFNRCTSTHHKLALDALRFVRGPHAELWSNLFLSNHEQFLSGAKAPDNEFKDFKNHVLHVSENYWGGALTSARTWYQRTVVALSQGDWPTACYNAGVLSHYFTDPFQPFHTGQTEEEGKVHRAAEWSICKSYDQLQAILEQDLSGYPEYELPAQPDWLEEMIRQGAHTAHESYLPSIEHYDLNRGVKDPPSGLDQELKDRLARLIGLAVVGYARVLERAFAESAATPPDVAVSLHVLLASMKVPLNWIRKKFTDLQERAIVEAIYLEVQETGKAVESLPEDERAVRKLHAIEVLKVPVRQLDETPTRPTGTQYGTGTPTRGAVAQPISSVAYQRTVISTSPALELPRGAAAPVELCLTVPLAKQPPPDFVADAVVAAYLKEQQASAPAPAPVEQQFAAVASSAMLRSPTLQFAPTPPQVPATTARGTVIEPKEPAAPIAVTRPVLAEPVPTQRDLDRRERKLQKQLAKAQRLEPQIPLPELPAVWDGNAEVTAGDMSFDMFAPLPPARPPAQQESPSAEGLTGQKLTAGAVSSQSTATSKPVQPPPVVSSRPAAPASVIPPGRSTSATPGSAINRAPTTPPVAHTTGTGSRPASAPVAARPTSIPTQPAPLRTLTRDPSTPVPAPHIRLPDPVDTPAPPAEQTYQNRFTAADGFDFSGFTKDGTQDTSGPGAITPLPLNRAANQPPVPRVPPTNPAGSAASRGTPPPVPSRGGAPDASTSAGAAMQRAAPMPDQMPAPLTRRFFLEVESPVVDAPSIGPKTSDRLEAIGIRTVADLLRANVEQAAAQLGNRNAAAVMKEWQDQARLVCAVPNLRGHDAQFLVACDVRTARQLRDSQPQTLFQRVQAFLNTSAGQRLLRGGSPPDMAEITEWIVAARDARPLNV